jgi:ABC-type tungstate transport system permease subunit
VSKNVHPEVNEEAGRAFVDWITSDEVQALIGAFRESGQLLFTPVAGLR